jgi:hypothetical protein
MSQMPLDDLANALATLMDSEVLVPTLALVNSEASADSNVQSISFGLNFEGEVVLGFTATLGYAIDPADPNSGSVTFLTLGLDEGVEAGALTGLQLGFWVNSPEDLGGPSVGAEVLIDDDLGATVGAYWTPTDDFLGIALTFAVGIDDGIEFQESYTFVLTSIDLAIPPIVQPDATHFLILSKLTCENISGGDGDHNEVFFTFKPDSGAVYPYPTWDYFAMAEGDTWYCGRSVKFDSQVAIVLYDVDGTSGNDKLGNITINYSDFSDVANGTDVSFKISSQQGLDDREYHMYAKLIF